MGNDVWRNQQYQPAIKRQETEKEKNETIANPIPRSEMVSVRPSKYDMMF